MHPPSPERMNFTVLFCCCRYSAAAVAGGGGGVTVILQPASRGGVKCSHIVRTQQETKCSSMQEIGVHKRWKINAVRSGEA